MTNLVATERQMAGKHNIYSFALQRQKPDDKIYACKISTKPAIAAMHGPHSVFDIGHFTVTHCYAGGVSLVDQ